MSGPEIIVIGTSAGGLKALSAVLGNLPAGLDAACEREAESLDREVAIVRDLIVTDIGTRRDR